MRYSLFSGLSNVLCRMHTGDVGITYMYGFILISLTTAWRQSQHGHEGNRVSEGWNYLHSDHAMIELVM